MPEFLRSMVVILILAAAVFAFARSSACGLIEEADFSMRRNAWFGLTMVAFLAQNFWLYVFAASLLLNYLRTRESNRVALYLSLLFVLPPIDVPIPAFGVVNYLVSIDHLRILALVILLPIFLELSTISNTERFGRTLPDKALALYLVLYVLLQLRETSVTDTLRQAFNLFVDVFLPYFVLSRSLQSVQEFRQALLGFMLTALVMSCMAVFESLRHWLLYQSLSGALGAHWGYLNYLGRSGSLRAMVTTGQPIVLGYIIVTAIGFYFFLQASFPNKMRHRLLLVLLLAGLIAPLSRGPWLGAVTLLVVFTATGPDAVRRLVMMAGAGTATLLLMTVLPGGNKVLGLLPFIGNVEKENVDYRGRLIENALIVINHHPMFGSVDFTATPEMQAMIQGEGIIDVTNTYLLMLLQIGYVGTGLFVGFFALIAWGIFTGFRRLPDQGSDEYLLGRTLLATLLAILFIIATVSPITFVPVVYWSVAGMGMAYIQMLRKQLLTHQQQNP